MDYFLTAFEKFVTYGVLPTLIGAAILHFLVNRDRDVRIGTKVFDINVPDRKDDFYVALRKAIKNAKKEIVQYAEGFATEPSGRLTEARHYVDNNIREILLSSPDLTWTRIQTRNPCSEKWFLLLQELLKEFPNRFKVYLTDNRPNEHVFSVAALIDPNMKCNKTFLLISKPKNMGGTEAMHVGDVGLVIQGSQLWSKSLDEQLNRVRDPSLKYVTLITSDMEFDKLPKPHR